MDEDVIIILSGDEDSICDEPSVLIVEAEEVKNSSTEDGTVGHPIVLEEDLVITFSQSADVLPHARYDCPIHPFTTTESETSAPVDNNHLICDQCFCYVCDKVASSCVVWHHTGMCHCNSHKWSKFWSTKRDDVVLGCLQTFNLTLSEVDTHLRQAEKMLQSFRSELATEFSVFRYGKTALQCGLSQSNYQGLYHDYTRVYEVVSSFLIKADEQEDRAAAIMRLGAAQDFIQHYQPSGTVMSESPMANANDAKVILLQRVIASVQRQMVMADFTPEFIHKLTDFYRRLSVPPTLKNSLCVRPWEDVLLVSVLKGQNVTGTRKIDKRKTDHLDEPGPVVLLRTERLQRQGRYTELRRYIQVVQTNDVTVKQEVRELIPLCLCMVGNFDSAQGSLFPLIAVSRFTPNLFLLYLRIFSTATAPTMTMGQSAKPVFSNTAWEPIEGAVPLSRIKLVKFALKVQRCSTAIYSDAQCWVHVLNIVNTSSHEPDPLFLQNSRSVVNSILSQQGMGLFIPPTFLETAEDQALLLLVTGALALRIMHGPLSPALPVLQSFKENFWALQWLWESLSSSSASLQSFMQGLNQELRNMADGDKTCVFLSAFLPSIPSSRDEVGPTAVVAGPDS